MNSKIYWPLDEVKVVGQNDEPEIHLENLDSFRKRQFGVSTDVAFPFLR